MKTHAGEGSKLAWNTQTMSYPKTTFF